MTMSPSQPMSPSQMPVPTVIPPDRLQTYETYFTNMDTSSCGFVTGEQCLQFFQKSGLDNADLSKIWCLAVAPDSSTAILRREEFVLAVHLISCKVGGCAIPQVLPPELVPSTHKTGVTKSHATPVASASAATSTPSSVISLSSPSLPTPATNDALHAQKAAVPPTAQTPSPVPPASAQQQTLKRQQLYQTQNISGSTDEDAQIAELNSRTEKMTLERHKTTSTITALSLRSQELALKLGQMRALHVTEAKIMVSLREAHEQATAEVNELESEASMLERTLLDLRDEKTRLTQAEADHVAETTRLRARISALNREVAESRISLAAVRNSEAEKRGTRDIYLETANNVDELNQRLRADITASKTASTRSLLDLSPSGKPLRAIEFNSVLTPGSDSSNELAGISSVSPIPSNNPLGNSPLSMAQSKFPAVSSVATTSSDSAWSFPQPGKSATGASENVLSDKSPPGDNQWAH